MTELTIHQQNQPQFNSKQRNVTSGELAIAQTLAPIVHTGRLYKGVASPEQALLIMVKGCELGIPFASAFDLIQIINGQASLIPRGALALVYQSGLLTGMKVEYTANSCTVWMEREGQFEHTETFSIDDAKRAGLVKPDSGWEKYPRNMMRWRAVGFLLDWLFPDVLAGLKTADQYGANIDQDGNIIESEA